MDCRRCWSSRPPKTWQKPALSARQRRLPSLGREPICYTPSDLDRGAHQVVQARSAFGGQPRIYCKKLPCEDSREIRKGIDQSRVMRQQPDAVRSKTFVLVTRYGTPTRLSLWRSHWLRLIASIEWMCLQSSTSSILKERDIGYSVSFIISLIQILDIF